MSDMVSSAPSKEGRFTRLKLKPLWLFYALLIFLLFSVLSFVVFRPILVLPRISLSPGYALIDQDGNQLTNEDMRGKVVLYQVTHTNCEPPCWQTNDTMRQVQARLSEIDTGRVPVELVTISLDPERDTPEVLRRFAAAQRADLKRWHFVTGPIDRLKWIVGGGFGVYFDHKEDGQLDYDPALMLVDGFGLLRAEYITGDPGAERVMRDLNLILEEIERSKGVNKVAYEAAHLFMCYP